MFVNAMFYEHSMTVNWCREFTVNLAIFKKYAFNFSLFDRDFRLALPIFKGRRMHK